MKTRTTIRWTTLRLATGENFERPYSSSSTETKQKKTKVAEKNEELLATQNEELAEEYRAGV